MSDTGGEAPTPFETIVEAAGDPMYTLDEQGCFEYVNDALVDHVTYSRSELIGRSVALLLTDRAIERCVEVIRSLVHGERDAETVEIQVTPGDGTRRIAEVTIAMLPAAEGYRGTVGIVRDITELRRSEQQLAVLERILRHNLRNELTVITGRSEYLREQVDDEALERQAAHICAAAERIQSISEGVRELSTGVRSAEDLSTHDLAAVVDDVVEEQTTDFPEATVTVESTPPVPVLATSAVRLVVQELVQNALEHGSDRPTVTVSIRESDDEVVLRVVDDGPGIPETERRAIQQKTESPLEHGQGLGLWLVTWVLDSCGGDLSLESPDDGGTVAAVRLQRPESGHE